MTDKKKQRNKVTRDEENRMLMLLLEGKSPYMVGKLVGRDRGVVVRVARKHQHELSDTILTKLKMATIGDGLDEYSRYLESSRRLRLLSQSLDRVARMMSRETLPARDMRDLTVSLGILIDKFQVESGKGDEDAKASLIALFQKMEGNITVNNNGVACTSGEASTVHSIEAEAHEYTVGELEEQQVNSGGSEVDQGCSNTS